MRHIIKLPLKPQVAAVLAEKQASINTGAVPANWKLAETHRKEIRNRLLFAQKNICCYCESKISVENYHIEHFIEQNDDATLIYVYENLFLSCEGEANKKNNAENTSCGHQKTASRHGNIAIDYDLLLNPSNTTTETLFAYADDGSIAPSKTCNSAQTEQADYTIKRLNLESVRLKTNRRNAIILLEKALKTMNETDTKNYIAGLLNEKQDDFIGFYSALRQNFEFLL
jgi:uncharacterized protein (TIGR02646 family)